MRTNLGKKSYFWPLPVAVVGSYDQNQVADAMTAAYSTLYDYNQIFVSMDLSHKTADNIKKTKAFTVAFATAETMVQADFVGLVSEKVDPNKLIEANLEYTKASFVNAPLFSAFPITCECKMISMDDGNLVGEIVNISVDDKYMKDGKIDVENINFITYDPYTMNYRLLGKVIGKGHGIGKLLLKPQKH